MVNILTGIDFMGQLFTFPKKILGDNLRKTKKRNKWNKHSAEFHYSLL